MTSVGRVTGPFAACGISYRTSQGRCGCGAAARDPVAAPPETRLRQNWSSPLKAAPQRLPPRLVLSFHLAGVRFRPALPGPYRALRTSASPPDFSPGPTPVTPAADMLRRMMVAPREGGAARRSLYVQAARWQRFGPILPAQAKCLQRLWMTIRRRRRRSSWRRSPAARGCGCLRDYEPPGASACSDRGTGAPAEPPPPPPRPSSRTRGTTSATSSRLRSALHRLTCVRSPCPFSRPGIRMKWVCRCTINPGCGAPALRVRTASASSSTIEGQFPSARTVTSRLDAPVLDGMVTVTNTRGETCSARASRLLARAE